MIEKLNDIIKLIYIGTFISILALAGIIINKYSAFYRQGSELNITLYSLCVFAISIPFVLYFTRNFTGKKIISGFLLLIFLYIDLFVWILIFHGFKAMPSILMALYFLIPPGIYFLATIVCAFLTVKNKTGEKL